MKKLLLTTLSIITLSSTFSSVFAHDYESVEPDNFDDYDLLDYSLHGDYDLDYELGNVDLYNNEQNKFDDICDLLAEIEKLSDDEWDLLDNLDYLLTELEYLCDNEWDEFDDICDLFSEFENLDDVEWVELESISDLSDLLVELFELNDLSECTQDEPVSELEEDSEVDQEEDLEVELEEDSEVDLEEDLEVELEEDSEVDQEEDSEVELEKDSEVDQEEDLEVDQEEDSEVDQVEDSEVDQVEEPESFLEIDPATGIDIQPLAGINIQPLTGTDIQPFAATTAVATSNHQVSTITQSGVTRNNINLRRGPGLNYRVIRTVNQNTNMRVTGRVGDWYRVNVGGTTGFMIREGVARTRQTAVVATNNAHVRAGRGTNHRSLARVNRGQRFTVTRRSPNWSRITVNGRNGWIRNSDLHFANAMRPGRTTTNNVAVRVRPSANAAVRQTLSSRHTRLMIIQRTTDGWTQIRLRHNGGTLNGWVRTNQIERRLSSRRAVRNGALRSGPSINFTRTNTIPRNATVTVRSRVGSWYNVRVTINGRRQYGWTHQDNIQRLSLTGSNSNSNSNSSSSSNPSLANRILQYAQRYMGRRHVMGGSSPARGFDCSGFTQWIFSVHGVTIPRTAQAQFNSSTRISRANARPGDLVFFERTFSSPDRITHVGLYVGGGRMLHVSSSRGVTFDNIHSGWWANHFVAYGRVLR